MYEKLFSGIKLRGLELKNRVVFPAMGSRFCTDDGYVLDQLIDYHAARAAGGCGLNITEAVAVWKPGAVTRMLQISDDSYIAGLKKLTDAIHAAGGKACIQLWQAGMAAMQTPNATIVVPSDLPLGPGKVVPGATVETIQSCVKAFGEGARRAVEAGFDCVEFHGAHNYSPNAFLMPALNHRTDEYGGSLENRARYSVEAIREIRKNIPEDMPILVRIPAKDDDLPIGLTVDDMVEVAKMFKQAGADVLDVSRGNLVTALRYEVPSLDHARGFNVDNAAYIRKGSGMPTIAVGRINDPDQAEAILSADKADMVVIGRGQIADPEFCNKAKAGRVQDILRCVGCNQGCYENCLVGEPITCMRNPSVGREAEFAALKPAAQPKKVLVVGGGVGGMEAAVMTKKLGHDVTIAEASDHLGGQLILAGKAPRKEEMEIAVLQRADQIQRAGVEVDLNAKVDAAYLDAYKPDAVICAIGASPAKLEIPGIDGKQVYTAPEVLSGEKIAKGAAAVVGGGLVGLEVAEYVRKAGGPVTVIEMLDEVAKDVGPGRKADIMVNIQMAGIETVTNAKCVRISEDGVTVDIKGEEKLIPADSVIIAIGSKANDASWLADYCGKKNIPCKVIGDAVKARRALQAIHEGVAAAQEI